ncbi:MAG: hypothetical protein HXX13_11720 [Bacteroidetes bacterium]|nr:hypothetical protein [Bacteroidota bacterium]
MKKEFVRVIATTVLIMVACFVMAQTKVKIDKSGSKGNVVFLVVTEGSKQLPEATNMAIKTQRKYPKSEVIAMDRTDKANSTLVTKYGLAGAPLPIILVIATNGVVAGGLQLSEATPEDLLDLVPTKRQAAALLAFSENKPAFIVLYKKNMKDKLKVVEECNKAAAGLGGKAVVVEVDLDDKSETGFMSLLKPDMKATTTHVLVFNAKGQFTDEHKSPVQSAILIASSKKVVKSSCAPGACGSGGCGKK